MAEFLILGEDKFPPGTGTLLSMGTIAIDTFITGALTTEDLKE